MYRRRSRFGRGFSKYGKYSRSGFKRRQKYEKRMELNYKDYYHSTVSQSVPGTALQGFFGTVGSPSIDDSPRFVGFHDTPANTTVPPTIDDCNLTGIHLGTNIHTRVGRKVLVKDITVCGKVYLGAVTADEVPNQTDIVPSVQNYSHVQQHGIVHMALLCHRACQGTTPNPGMVYESMNFGSDLHEGTTMLRNKDFTSSYLILKKWTKKIVWLNWDDVGSQGSRGFAVMDKRIKVNKIVSYYPNNPTGTVAGISDNALYLMVWADQVHPTFAGAASLMVRVNFYDI